jgi:hypothetical protein
MVGMNNGVIVPRAVRAREAQPSTTAKTIIGVLMIMLLVAAVAGVVVALSAGLPTVALVIALVSGAVFAGSLC